MAAGAAIHRLRFGRIEDRRRRLVLLILCVGLSVVPDLDAAVGIAFGDLGRYHNNFAGSPAFGTLVALFAGGVVWLFRRHLARQATVLVFVCYQVHVFMDFLTISRGSMMLWPFTTERFEPPVRIFYGLRWSHGPVSDLHLITLVTESVFVVVLAVLVVWLERRRSRRAAGRESRRS